MMFDNNKKWFQYVSWALIFLVVFGVGYVAGNEHIICADCTPANTDLSLFWDAYNKLHNTYVDPSKISDQEVVYGAISGMTDSIGDPYTEFFNPTQAKAFNQDLSGSFGGIGIEVGVKNGQLTIVAPLKGTPGERAGLKSGDEIAKVDGKDTSHMSMDEAVNAMRGVKGTQVTLSIFRQGWTDIKDIKITRDIIKVNAVDWSLKDGDVAYIHISEFNETLSADFQKAVREILNSPAKRIVLDLRNNPGGYLETAQTVAGWFLEPNQVVTIEDFGKAKPQQDYKTSGSGTFADYPTVVLINKGSASASEILAGALRDDRNVQLIGEQSFGKGSVQQVLTLSDNKSLLKITIAKWLTPKGNSISEVGLTPDVKVDLTEDDMSANKDPQLDKALELVKNLK